MPTPPAPAPSRLRIGIFDSGVGGLSVLRAIHARLPGADLHYVADAAHAPYGDRDEATIRDRSLRVVGHLRDAGAQLVVVACNTATAASIAALREHFAPLPIVGVEPGLRPALAATRNGRVGVMATAATLCSERFRMLLERESGGRPVHLQACVGLADAIERGELDDPALAAVIERHCAPLRAAGVDSVALGCTHYPFVRPAIEHALGAGVTVIDTADAVAAQVVRVAATLPATDTSPDHIGRRLLQSTGDTQALQRFAAHWLSFPFDAEALPHTL